MGFALATTCPNCNDTGEHKVERTEALSYYESSLALLGLAAEDILYRKRHRSCSKCGLSFATVEISEDDFSKIVTAALAHAEASGAERRLLDEVLSDLSETVSRATTFRVLLIIMKVFGSSETERAKAFADGLDSETRKNIIDTCMEVLDSLGEEDCRAVISNYGLLFTSDKSLCSSASQKGDFQRALRKLRHPSRSRKLRQIFARIELD